jgi:hypothetical protein
MMYILCVYCEVGTEYINTRIINKKIVHCTSSVFVVI